VTRSLIASRQRVLLAFLLAALPVGLLAVWLLVALSHLVMAMCADCSRRCWVSSKLRIIYRDIIRCVPLPRMLCGGPVAMCGWYRRWSAIFPIR
jgi:hypothetical protein